MPSRHDWEILCLETRSSFSRRVGDPPVVGRSRSRSRLGGSGQAPGPAIAAKAAATDDADIANRIRDIFGQIAALHDVRVRVSAGVVTLAGTVPAAGDGDRAEAIASRVSGVVTLQNDVTRDLAVGTVASTGTVAAGRMASQADET